jgi:hypothetical protein
MGRDLRLRTFPAAFQIQQQQLPNENIEQIQEAANKPLVGATSSIVQIPGFKRHPSGFGVSISTRKPTRPNSRGRPQALRHFTHFQPLPGPSKYPKFTSIPIHNVPSRNPHNRPHLRLRNKPPSPHQCPRKTSPQRQQNNPRDIKQKRRFRNNTSPSRKHSNILPQPPKIQKRSKI